MKQYPSYMPKPVPLAVSDFSSTSLCPLFGVRHSDLLAASRDDDQEKTACRWTKLMEYEQIRRRRKEGARAR